MPVYFIQSETVQKDRVIVDGELAHHLRTVLRLAPGEQIDLVDETRTRYRVAVEEVDRPAFKARILRREDAPDKTGTTVGLAFGLLKGKKTDWLIQKATELGASSLFPVISDRTINRPDPERRAHSRDRLSKIALEAAQQCERLDVPVVHSIEPLEDFLRTIPESACKIILWEDERERSFREGVAGCVKASSVFLLVGPEGGFTPEEVEAARRTGWNPVTLGRRTLRAETAGLAALAVLDYELGKRS